MFLLNRDVQFYWQGKVENPEKTTDILKMNLHGYFFVQCLLTCQFLVKTRLYNMNECW
jgi:hypothetical protein